jgi:hypothetical protein
MRPAVAVFAVAALAQWLVPLVGVWQHERVIARGVAVRIPCAAPDPYDPLRGRYLAVRPAETGAPAPEGMPDRAAAPVWATLVVGDDGLARIDSLTLERVSGPTVIRLVARPSGTNNGERTVILEWPLDRFYLNERLATDADTLLAERLAAGTLPVAEIRLLDGRAVLTDLLLDGTPVRELVRRRRE